MGKELVISKSRHETKVAILEDDQLVEVFFQRVNEYSLAGSIHKGRVTRVLPGMQSAFVDIGLGRDAFLYVSDFFEDNEEYDKIAGAAEEKALKAERPARGVATMPAPAVEPAAVPAEVTAPGQERAEEPEGHDRKGRRSRRRRSRGRGFPESKYAHPEEGAEAPKTVEPSRTAEPSHAAERGPEREFSILPGETLAKYRRAGSEENPSETAAEAITDTAAEEFQTAGESGTAAAAPPEEKFSITYPMPAVAPPIGEEFAAHPATASAAGAAATTREEARQLAITEPLREDLVADAGRPEPHELAASRPEAPPLEPANSQALLPEEAGEQDEEPALVTDLPDEVIPEQPETGEQIAAEAEEGAPHAEEVTPASTPVSLTATLREQGYRYMHRVSRRMRRKMRPGPPPEGQGQATEPRPPALQEVSAPEPSANGLPDQRGPRQGRKAEQSITELLKEGQEVLVQIAKEPLGQKGARITSHIALPGRYVVYMPTVEHLGVSRKIVSEDERLRLKRILQAHRSGIPGGFIVRTAGEGKSEDDIASDIRFLFNMWLDIRQKAESRPAPALIHHDLDLVSRILRDQMAEPFKSVWVDNEEIYEGVLRFVERFQPAAVGRVKLYTRNTPIFDAFNVSSELEKALRPKVWLKSGGYIVINQTEALVAIDVNTGKFVGRSNRLEDTIVRTNTEAVKEIVRQIRLRDLGGIIVVDFIDMDERKNRQKVMQALEEAIRADKAPNKVLQFNDFGLVAITRKRVKQSLERTLCAPCPYCEGSGYVKSVQTVISEILQEAQKIARDIEGTDVTLRVSPEVAKILKASDNQYLEELEEILGRAVLVVSDPLLQQEKFDLI